MSKKFSVDHMLAVAEKVTEAKEKVRILSEDNDYLRDRLHNLERELEQSKKDLVSMGEQINEVYQENGGLQNKVYHLEDSKLKLEAYILAHGNLEEAYKPLPTKALTETWEKKYLKDPTFREHHMFRMLEDLHKKGEKIGSIKCFRGYTGEGLKVSKDFVEWFFDIKEQEAKDSKMDAVSAALDVDPKPPLRRWFPINASIDTRGSV